MKRLIAGLLIVSFFCSGCDKSGSVESGNKGQWSSPQEVGKSADSLQTSFSLHKWNGTLLTLGGENGTFATRVLDEDGKNWKTISTIDPGWIPMDADPKENRFVISGADLWSDRLDARFAVGSLSPDGQFLSKTSAPIHLSKGELFGTENPNLMMDGEENGMKISFNRGIIEDAEMRIPYSITATPMEGKVIMAGKTISANGVFASSDGGQTWHANQIFISKYSEIPIVCRTKSFYYYITRVGQPYTYELQYSRSPIEEDSWSHPEALNKTFAHNLSVPNLLAWTEDDIVHVCWLDSRNERSRFSLASQRGKNYEVAYCNRKDSDAGWSKDVILSKGLQYAYAPSISVEGNKLVVAWAGVRSGEYGRTEYGTSDIYYVTSKDGGKAWTKPMQITHGFKSGITSGRPQVALHNGVIHLFYVQGKLNFKSVSGGMVKLNQPGWPIYYQQRPFPE